MKQFFLKQFLFVVFMLLSLMAHAQNSAITPPKAIKELFSNPQKRKASIAKDEISSDGLRWIWGDWYFNKRKVASHYGFRNSERLYYNLSNMFWYS